MEYTQNNGEAYVSRIPFSGGYIEAVKTSSAIQYLPRYWFTDHLGSVRSIVNQTGAVIEANDFTPFGKRWEVASRPKSSNRYLFNGKQELTCGYLDYGARLYDPEIGRWIQPDPLADVEPGNDPYVYCANNPVMNIDPTGMSTASASPQIFKSPVFNAVTGDFMGVDDMGFLGEPLFLDRRDFKPGMSHLLAFKLNKGEGFLNFFAFKKYFDFMQGAVTRPDYDGKLTLREANYWYRNGNGQPLFVDINSLDIPWMSLEDVAAGESKTVNLLYCTLNSPIRDGRVFGSITFTRNSDGSISASSDYYDFDMKNWKGNSLRNILTLIGQYNAGTGLEYNIFIYGNKPASLPAFTRFILSTGSVMFYLNQ